MHRYMTISGHYENLIIKKQYKPEKQIKILIQPLELHQQGL